jgi:hypothetical protein
MRSELTLLRVRRVVVVVVVVGVVLCHLADPEVYRTFAL